MVVFQTLQCVEKYMAAPSLTSFILQPEDPLPLPALTLCHSHPLRWVNHWANCPHCVSSQPNNWFVLAQIDRASQEGLADIFAEFFKCSAAFSGDSPVEQNQCLLTSGLCHCGTPHLWNVGQVRVLNLWEMWVARRIREPCLDEWKAHGFHVLNASSAQHYCKTGGSHALNQYGTWKWPSVEGSVFKADFSLRP